MYNLYFIFSHVIQFLNYLPCMIPYEPAYVNNICISNKNFSNFPGDTELKNWYINACINRAFRSVWVAKDKNALILHYLTCSCNTCMSIRLFYNFVFHSNVIVKKSAIYFTSCRFKLNNIHSLYRRKEKNVVNSKHCIWFYFFLNWKLKTDLNVVSSILENWTMLCHFWRNTYK